MTRALDYYYQDFLRGLMVILFFSVQQIALFSMDIPVIRPKRYVTNNRMPASDSQLLPVHET